MKPRSPGTGYGISSGERAAKVHRKHHAKKHHAHRAHTKRVPYATLFNIPDEQMSEPPVVPKDERRYWH